MKCRRVKPNPCEFFWRKMVRGPCHDTPSTSPDDSGRRLFSLDDTMPSLRPLAYWGEEEDGENVAVKKNKKNTQIWPLFNFSLGRKMTFTERMLQSIILRQRRRAYNCDSKRKVNWFKGSVGGCGCVSSIGPGRIPSMPGIFHRLPASISPPPPPPPSPQRNSPIITFITSH